VKAWSGNIDSKYEINSFFLVVIPNSYAFVRDTFPDASVKWGDEKSIGDGCGGLYCFENGRASA
jgi:hypothetical protein